MMDLIGAPQIVALVILAQRGLEDLHSARNTRRLLAAGGHETGRNFYPVVMVTHLSWIAAIFLLIPPDSTIIWPFLAFYLALQAARYWIIASLGRYWTHRIITPREGSIVTHGPFRLMRHPNYLVVILETALLPLAFGAWAVAVIMTAVVGVVLQHKIELENQALAARAEG